MHRLLSFIAVIVLLILTFIPAPAASPRRAIRTRFSNGTKRFTRRAISPPLLSRRRS